MLTLQLRYLRYAIVSAILTVLSALVLPILQNQTALMHVKIPHLMWMVFGIAALFVAIVDVRMVMQAYQQKKQENLTTLWVPVIGQSLWFATVAWLYKIAVPGDFLRTMTLPLALAGLTLILLSLGLLQRRERAIPLDKAMQQNTRRLTWVTVVLAIYAVLFFGLTINWQSGLTVAAAVLIIVDPRWSAFWAGWRRFRILRALAADGITFQNPHALDNVRHVKDVVVEKTGILTSETINVHSVTSLDERYSDFDILGITTGLLEPFDSELTRTVLAFAEERGIYPSSASELEEIDFVGVKGVILNERFSIISAAYALDQGYDIDEQTLMTYKELGNSVSYIVDGLQVIGVITFATSLHSSLLAIDRFFTERRLNLHVATADTAGSMKQLQKLMSSLTDTKTDLTPDAKQAQLQQWLNAEHTMLITNQTVPTDVKPAITVAVGDTPAMADIHVKEVTDLNKLWNTTDALLGADTKVLNWTSLILLVIVLLTAGVGIFITPYLFIAPIVAAIVRLALSLTLLAVVDPDKS